MHIPTHVLSGWCAANLLPLGPRERTFCMVAATLPDLDGLGMVVDKLGLVADSDFYDRYHHVLGHNLAFAVLTGTILTAFSARRVVAFCAYLALFHLHLVMDYYGSGPGWGISYWWPFGLGPGYAWVNPRAWEFFSWQNITAGYALLGWTVAIAYVCRRTPLEWLMPGLDEKLIRFSRRGKTASTAPAAAAVETTR